MPSAKRLRILAVAQVALGIVTMVMAPLKLPDVLGLSQILPPFGLERILIVPVFALAMGQAVLIALWGVASRSSPWWRLAGLVAGTAYLEAILAFSLNSEFLGAATVTIALTTVALFLVRALGVKITRQAREDRADRHEPDGLQFSVRGLMTFTALVALLSAGARALQASHWRFIFMAALWALCFVVVGLIAIWASLGQALPRWRVPVMIVLSPALGGMFAYASKAHKAGQLYIILIMLLYPAVLLVSLLVVRLCGYRLVGRATQSPEMPPVGMDMDEPSALMPTTGEGRFPGLPGLTSIRESLT